MTLLFADLCAIFTRMIEHVTTKRGQLRIYLGAADVGKTAMLGEAHRDWARHRRGRGHVETRTQQDRETRASDDPAALRRISGCHFPNPMWRQYC